MELDCTNLIKPTPNVIYHVFPFCHKSKRTTKSYKWMSDCDENIQIRLRKLSQPQ